MVSLQLSMGCEWYNDPIDTRIGSVLSSVSVLLS